MYVPELKRSAGTPRDEESRRRFPGASGPASVKPAFSR